MMKLVVLSCVLAAVSASGFIAPYAAYAPYAPIAYSSYLTPYNSNYRGPLSLAPGQPANILGADGRPLDTLEVNLDRSAHLTAKAFNGVHLLKKRSASYIAPVTKVVAHTPYVAPGHVAYSAPAHVAYSAPLASHYSYPYAYSATPFVHY